MKVFDQHESEVRGYVRSFPVVFDRSKGSLLFDEDGNRFIDFFAGAGALNYGHNDPQISQAVIDYIQRDGIQHALDKATVAKRHFIEKLYTTVLEPRGLGEYKIQFTGPTGTNAVEAALKVARKAKNRSNVISFTNGFHGLSMGSLSITANSIYHDPAYPTLSHVTQAPFDQYLGEDYDTIDYLRRTLEDKSSGMQLPAAIVLETVQAEGGINIASDEWLRDLRTLCDEFDILMIVDDIQVGNGRTGNFFSFERAGIKPDIITLSKSVGTGYPMAVVLMKPEVDVWEPGEHTGTFRGFNHAFVGAAKALERWDNDDLKNAVEAKGKIVADRFQKIADTYPELEAQHRGIGMIHGLEIPAEGLAGEVSEEAFQNNLIIELCGAENHVIKFLAPLVIEEDILQEGLDILENAIKTVLERRKQSA